MTGHSSGRDSDLERLLRRRRMTRAFDGGPELADVTSVASLALRAPTAGFSQGVHLVVLTDTDLEGFWVRTGAAAWFADRAPGVLAARHLILVFGVSDEYTERYAQDDKRHLGLDSTDRWHTPFWIVDAGMVVQNLLLLAEERRWGALFFGLHGDQGSYFGELGVPTSAHCVGAVAIGFRSAADVPSGSPVSRARREPNEVVHIGAWTR